MKKWFVLVWLLVPVGLLSYHFGPGQEARGWSESRLHVSQAKKLESEGHWEEAIAAYQQALTVLPASDETDGDEALARDQLRLSQINARFELGHLQEAIDELRLLATEVDGRYDSDSPVALDVRDLLGRVHFRAMVALRLESAEEAVWKRQWELSRQNYRHLAEHSTGPRNRIDRQNLEAVIKSANLPEIAFATPTSINAVTTGLTTKKAKVKANANGPPQKTADARALVTPQKQKKVDPPEFELGN